MKDGRGRRGEEGDERKRDREKERGIQDRGQVE